MKVYIISQARNHTQCHQHQFPSRRCNKLRGLVKMYVRGSTLHALHNKLCSKSNLGAALDMLRDGKALHLDALERLYIRICRSVSPSPGSHRWYHAAMASPNVGVAQPHRSSTWCRIWQFLLNVVCSAVRRKPISPYAHFAQPRQSCAC